MRIGKSYYITDIPDDDNGLDRKIGIIAEMIRESRKTGEVKTLAKKITENAYNDWEKINAVYYWLRDNMDYEPDREADDVFIAPHRQIKRLVDSGIMWGDCDDYTIMGGSLLYNLGIPIRLVVVATKNSVDGKWNHIFFQAFDRMRRFWITMDAVKKGREIGRTVGFNKNRVYNI